jgi:chemotaxis protein CheX
MNEKVMIEEIEKLVGEAIGHVFRTMLNMEIVKLEGQGLNTDGQEHVAGAVGFIGRFTGVIYLYTEQTFARTLTGSLLGLGETEIGGDEMVNDAMGEMANMVGGQVKSTLNDRGMPCVLTIPSIVRGKNFTIEPMSSTERRLLCFGSQGQKFFVELFVKPSTETLH